MSKLIGVVEDNPDNRLLLQAILGDMYEIVEWESAVDALKELRELKELPKLLLLDISLPEMDGLAALKVIRADDVLKKLPVIALTAHAMAGDRERYLGEGFDDYVTKPIADENILLQAIKKWV